MIRKIGLMLVLAIVLTMVFTSCTMAEENTITKDSKVKEEKNIYTITPAKIPTEDKGDVQIKSVSSTITQGETIWHTKYLGYSTTTMYTHLYWGDTSDSLKLTIYTPDNQVFGPFYDSSDGSVNGRIDLRIKSSSSLPQGTWSYRVYGQSVSGTQSYSI